MIGYIALGSVSRVHPSAQKGTDRGGPGAGFQPLA